MPSIFILLHALWVLSFSTNTLAIPANLFERGGGDVCSSGIYGELAPILAPYSIAQEFCSIFYPACSSAKAVKRASVSSTVVTTTKSTKTSTSTVTSAQRTTSLTTPSSTTKLASTTTKSSSTITANPMVSAWSKCQAQGPNVVSTLCSCIEVCPKLICTGVFASGYAYYSNGSTCTYASTCILEPNGAACESACSSAGGGTCGALGYDSNNSECAFANAITCPTSGIASAIVGGGLD